MSRLTKSNSRYEIAYGFDHAFGWFIQVFDRLKFTDDDEGIIVNLDEITPDRIVEVALKYGFVIPIPSERIIYN